MTVVADALETPRLRLRRLTPADAPFLVELLNSPGFLAQIGDRGVRSREDAERYVIEGPQASFARHGHGLDLVETRADRRPIGICGLVRRDSLDGPDLGYAYLPDGQGQGFATEAGAAVLKQAWSAHGLRRVWAVVKPGNQGSVAVLTRLGFTARPPLRLDGQRRESLLFSVERPADFLSAL